MKTGIIALGATLMCTNMATGQTCISFELDVIKLDPVTNKGSYVQFDAGQTLHYGDRFRIKLLGEKPGVFHQWSIDPLGVKQVDYEPVQSSRLPVILPCGPETDMVTCPGTPGAPYIVTDSTNGVSNAEVETELLVISYTPCANENSPATSVALPSCDVLVDPARDMAKAYANVGRKEAIGIYGRGATDCGYGKDEMGNVVVYKYVEILTKR